MLPVLFVGLFYVFIVPFFNIICLDFIDFFVLRIWVSHGVCHYVFSFLHPLFFYKVYVLC